MPSTVRVKRVYDPVEEGDGFRVLVDRLWPRGLKKDAARIDLWFKEVAPTDALRKWYGHQPERFAQFRERYEQELRANSEAVDRLLELMRSQPVVTLLYAARDRERNQAVVLREFLEARLRGRGKKSGRRATGGRPPSRQAGRTPD